MAYFPCPIPLYRNSQRRRQPLAITRRLYTSASLAVSGILVIAAGSLVAAVVTAKSYDLRSS